MTITGKQGVDVCVVQTGSVSLSVCTLTVLCGWVVTELRGPERFNRLSKPSCVHVVVPVSPGLSATYRSGPNRSLPAYFFSRLGWILHGTTLIVTYM